MIANRAARFVVEPQPPGPPAQPSQSQAQAQNAPQSVSSRLTLRRFVELYYLPAKPGTRLASVENITSSINLLELWSGREVFCDELNRDFLLQFRAWRLQDRTLPCCTKHRQPMYKVRGTEYRCHQRGCSEKASHAAAVVAATANKDIRTLKALWREAIEHGDNAHPIKKIQKLKEDLDNQEAWTKAEVERIRQSCHQQPDELFVPCRMAHLCVALLEVLYDVGSRISAIMNSAPSDLDWTSGRLTLRAALKKDRKCQVYGLSREALEALKALSEGRTDGPGDHTHAYLFPWPHDRTRRGWPALTDRWKEVLRRAGLRASKKDLFHKVRRTTATQLTIKRGKRAAQEHLGHSHESVTERYIDNRQIDETKLNAQFLRSDDKPKPDAG